MPPDPDSPRTTASGAGHLVSAFTATRARFLEGFAAQVGLTVGDLARPGLSIAPRVDRAGSRAVACYQADRRLVLWCDPDVADRLASIGIGQGRTETAPATEAGVPDAAQLGHALATAGFEWVAEALMLVLGHQPPPVATPPGRYDHRSLRADDPSDMAAIRAFVDRSDPDDVEAAALDEIDDGFDEVAIEVLVDDGPDGDRLVAYASALAWDWDPGFSDIGVLVDRSHRGRGLARFVVARSIEAQLAAGLLPLYRHETSNPASAAVARSLGFVRVTSLSYFRLP
ncbi:MAG: GNAT family N-acetyltransferase [Acidimicrobiales bacterium]